MVPPGVVDKSRGFGIQPSCRTGIPIGPEVTLIFTFDEEAVCTTLLLLEGGDRFVSVIALFGKVMETRYYYKQKALVLFERSP
jgi:hypothetical protein